MKKIGLIILVLLLVVLYPVKSITADPGQDNGRVRSVIPVVETNHHP